MMPLAQYPGHGHTEICLVPSLSERPDESLRASHSRSFRIPTEDLRLALDVIGAPWPLSEQVFQYSGVLEGRLTTTSWAFFRRDWYEPAQHALLGKKIPANCSHNQIYRAVHVPSEDEEVKRQAARVTRVLRTLTEVGGQHGYNFVVIR